MPNDCPFCVRDPEYVGRVGLENEYCLFLEGVEPVLQGSGIIVPKAHRPTVFDLTDAEWWAVRDLLLKAREKMVRELAPDGFNVGWNCGEAGGQSIHHAHLHVIPRFADEPFAGKGIRHLLKSEANLRPSLRG
ncbi:MAG TPA: HIT domain-containing protein [Symbiobacteriaceae bacterium]|nr:HIT domain-containing protein [Symbiobacteriaceae bacterium]